MPIKTISHRATKGITREIKQTIDTSISGSIYENNPNFNKLNQSAATEPPGTYIHTFRVSDSKTSYVLLPDYVPEDLRKIVHTKTLLFGTDPISTWKQCEAKFLQKINSNYRNAITTKYTISEFIYDLRLWSARSFDEVNSKEFEYSSDWMASKYYIGPNYSDEQFSKLSEKQITNLLGFGRLALSDCVTWLSWITGFRENNQSKKMIIAGAKSDIFCKTNNKNKIGYTYSEQEFYNCAKQVVLVSDTSTRDLCRELYIDKENNIICFKNEL